jgi:HEAT repeat protein
MNLATFEMFLDRLDPDRRADQLSFFRIIAAVGVQAVELVEPRVHRVSCPAGLRQLALEFSYYYPWPEWIPMVERVLRYEKDLALFTTGVRTLGKIRSPRALAVLRDLSMSRATPGFREILDRVLRESDPALAFEHHFARLLQGSSLPSDANEGAHQLGKLLTPESLELLKGAVGHPDALVFRHALRLVGQIPSQEAAAYLLELFVQTHHEALEDREVRLQLSAFRHLPRPDLLEQVTGRLVSRLEASQATAAADLTSGQAPRILAAADTLRAAGLGLLDAFLLETFLAARDEKPGPLAKHLTQANDAAQQRARRFEFVMDSAAQSLTEMALQGLIETECLLPPLAESLRQHTGRAGAAAALARLIQPDAQELLDLLLDEPDGTIRSAAVEALGDRKDPALRSALLKVRKDAISDIASRGLWHLGQLPDPIATAREFIAQPDPEEVALGLRFIAMHHLKDLVPDLLDLSGKEAREATQVAAVETLGAIGSAEAVDGLLTLLHSGQNPRVRTALAEALRDLGDPEGALKLAHRALEMNDAELSVAAVEAFAKAHGSSTHPLPAAASSVLVAVVESGWSSRPPWTPRRRIADALQAIHLTTPSTWVGLTALVQATLSEKRHPGEVSFDDLAHLQACARALAQRT